MERQFSFAKAPACESGLRKWIRENGSFKMKGSHKLVVVKEKEFGGKPCLICKDPSSSDGGLYIIPSGLFTALQEYIPDIEILIPELDENGKETGMFTVSDKQSFKFDDEGMLQLA